MRMVDIIEKKKNNKELTKEEIKFVIDGYVSEDIPDYQVSALLMAIYFNSMNDDEIFYLTDAMLHSGDVVDLSNVAGIKCDKHSTGGVGDKTSLVVGPLLASFGIKVAKMSGRGLGHTGGTLDKLESIEGFNIELSGKDFIKQVNEIGLAIIGQSKNITPADKLLYALRDVTATVNSIPLIASSIMSKKLASGADHIALDVKVGNGAFMKTVEEATVLAEKMVEIGKKAGKSVIATLSDMGQPLGRAVGNSLEVIEAIDTLKGNGPKDFEHLCLTFVAELLISTKMYEDFDKAYVAAKSNLNNGLGLTKLREMIKAQGGNDKVIDDYSLFKVAEEKIDLTYEIDEEVYVENVDALMIGEAAMVLGAGRATKEEMIDHSVGIIINKKVGDCIKNGDIIATIYTNGKNTNRAIKMVLDSIIISKEKTNSLPLIIKTIK